MYSGSAGPQAQNDLNENSSKDTRGKQCPAGGGFPELVILVLIVEKNGAPMDIIHMFYIL